MSMYFVQHGVALDKSVDAHRPLSEQGKQDVEKIAHQLAKQDLGIKQVLHSGKSRSAQTASVIASILNVPKVQQIESLSPNDNIKQLISLLEDNCMYVGHLPHIGKIVSKLLCDNENIQIVQYENAAVVCISRDEAGCHLNWMLKPSIL